jgi:hypothetical protein
VAGDPRRTRASRRYEERSHAMEELKRKDDLDQHEGVNKCEVITRN